MLRRSVLFTNIDWPIYAQRPNRDTGGRKKPNILVFLISTHPCFFLSHLFFSPLALYKLHKYYKRRISCGGSILLSADENQGQPKFFPGHFQVSRSAKVCFCGLCLLFCFITLTHSHIYPSGCLSNRARRAGCFFFSPCCFPFPFWFGFLYQTMQKKGIHKRKIP